MRVFDYFMSHQDHFALFDQAMTGFSIAEADAEVSGFALTRVVQLPAPLHVIEATPLAD